MIIFWWWHQAPRIKSGALETNLKEQETLRFFAFGDFGNGSIDQLKVAAAMAKRCQEQKDNGLMMHGLLLLGDNFLPHGVNSTSDGAWSTKLLDVYGGPCLGQLPFYPVLGNHDYQGSPRVEIEKTAELPRWHMPHRFYSVTFGRMLRLIAFDSTFPDVCGVDTLCSIDFLKDQLYNGDIKWRIVFAHHPIVTFSEKYGRKYFNFYRYFMTRILCDYADAYLAGHSHMLEYHRISECMTSFAVSGGGGSSPYQPIPGASPEFAVPSYGFLEIELFTSQLIFRYFSEDNKLLFQKQVEKL